MNANEHAAVKDIILGSSFIIFGIVVCVLTQYLPEAVYDPLGPAFIPRLLGLACIATSCVILFHGIRKKMAASGARGKSRQEKAPVLFVRHPKSALFAMILFFLYILALDTGISGFRTLTTLFVLLLGGMLIKISRQGKAIQTSLILIALSFTLSFGLYYLFTQVFIVDLY
ncbi:MAG: tripartite tricarboxylate transporter TctB family protein [Spirochaetia bacterium]|jgi:hypothetical protein|nr:tripartite tricarboxylate transporter TctB family protein [Spirochaetia bacterium]